MDFQMQIYLKSVVSHQRLYHRNFGCITELGLIKLSLYPFCNSDVIMFSPCLVSPETSISCTQRKLHISTETSKPKFSKIQKQYCHTGERGRSWMSLDNLYTPLLLAVFVNANLSWKTSIKELGVANIPQKKVSLLAYIQPDKLKMSVTQEVVRDLSQRRNQSLLCWKNCMRMLFSTLLAAIAVARVYLKVI